MTEEKALWELSLEQPEQMTPEDLEALLKALAPLNKETQPHG